MTEQHIAAQETINTARAWIRTAVTEERHGVCLEAEAEQAYHYLEEATMALARDDLAYAKRDVTDAIEALGYYLDRPQRPEQREQIRTALTHMRAALASLEEKT